MRKTASHLYTIRSYFDMDGAIAAAICLRHLSDLQKFNKIKKVIKFCIEPVLRRKKHIGCISGILRENHKALGISEELIHQYDDLIDCAEIMHNKISDVHKRYDPFSLAQKLHLIFNTTHPLIDKKTLYQSLVYKISQNACIEELLDSDVLYAGIIQYERIKKNQFK